MRLLMLCLLVLAGAGALWFVSRGTSAPEPDLPAVHGPSAGRDALPAGARDTAEKAPEPGAAGADQGGASGTPPGASGPRAGVDSDEEFSALMRQSFEARDTAFLQSQLEEATQHLETMKVRMGERAMAGAPLDTGQEFPPDVLVYRGPDADRQMRVVELPPGKYPALNHLFRRQRWLQSEIERRSR